MNSPSNPAGLWLQKSNNMPSQVKATTQELGAVLSTIDNVVKKRAQTGYVDAGNGKKNANAKRIKVMMLGVQESITTKVKKVVKVVSHTNTVVTSGVDEEAVARVEACKKEMKEISERVERMRKEVTEKAKDVEAQELEVRGGVEFTPVEDVSAATLSGSSEGDSAAQIDAMRGSMTKLGNHLVNLAQTMPDKMEGLSKTIEAVTEGAVKASDEKTKIGHQSVKRQRATTVEE
ncbi:hypothetical protein TrRE_jg702 [Triparma retinervis]|uniref:Uncharacterized protein n=1 Tax=Triparma retinervis TaxID=2557542 RepID=A0A9W7AAK5_9STRA|nr:hypothetical protein TrRE_jg702 [Triparma retinervis]